MNNSRYQNEPISFITEYIFYYSILSRDTHGLALLVNANTSIAMLRNLHSPIVGVHGGADAWVEQSTGLQLAAGRKSYSNIGRTSRQRRSQGWQAQTGRRINDGK